jgi:hypothetical protein
LDEHPAQFEPERITPESAEAWAPPLSAPEWLEPPKPIFSLPLFFGLLAASFIATLAMLPFSYTLIKQMDTPLPEGVIPIALAATVVIETLLSAMAIALGVWLGPKLDMGRLFEADSRAGETATWRRIWDRFGLPLFIGIALGAIILVALSRFDISGTKGKDLTPPNAWEGLLASIGAGIREEIWLRFGLLTLFAWLGVLVVHAFAGPSKRMSPAVFWLANTAAALMFAAIHIPQAAALLGLNAGVLLVVFVGNGVPGLVFGWLYWRRGLVPAMLAHFGLDLVLKVVVPLFS